MLHMINMNTTIINMVVFKPLSVSCILSIRFRCMAWI